MSLNLKEISALKGQYTLHWEWPLTGVIWAGLTRLGGTWAQNRILPSLGRWPIFSSRRSSRYYPAWKGLPYLQDARERERFSKSEYRASDARMLSNFQSENFFSSDHEASFFALGKWGCDFCSLTGPNHDDLGVSATKKSFLFLVLSRMAFAPGLTQFSPNLADFMGIRGFHLRPTHSIFMRFYFRHSMYGWSRESFFFHDSYLEIE